ncbi:hypothetical protein FLK61_39460 [Paenalkalicoccus suaedae]|uniref:Uncharacterized protein n=1 Tax=Paenalkalicoccus suaedae TaxID=2592382 RepID=A0A859FIR9_9BACI|nr:hypothetical protein [Paenalkalicoccus suaedae]QKS72694.1 hypothetical protein FLK61_39460 [Paenalkalicoccus suaedae]
MTRFGLYVYQDEMRLSIDQIDGDYCINEKLRAMAIVYTIRGRSASMLLVKKSVRAMFTLTFVYHLVV